MNNSKKYLLTLVGLTLLYNINLNAMNFPAKDGDIIDLYMQGTYASTSSSNSSFSSSSSQPNNSNNNQSNDRKRPREEDNEPKTEGEKHRKTENMNFTEEINQREQRLNNISQEELYRIEHDTKPKTYNHNYQKERIISPQVTSEQEFEDTIKHIQNIWTIEAKFQNVVEQLNLIVQEIQKKLTALESAISQNNSNAGQILNLIEQSIGKAINIQVQASNTLGSLCKTTRKTMTFFKQANDLVTKIEHMSSSIHSQENVKKLTKQMKQNLAHSHTTSTSSSSAPMTATLGTSSISSSSSSTYDDDDDVDTTGSDATMASSSHSSCSSTTSSANSSKSSSFQSFWSDFAQEAQNFSTSQASYTSSSSINNSNSQKAEEDFDKMNPEKKFYLALDHQTIKI